MKILIKRLYAGLIDALFIGLTIGFIYYIFIGQSAYEEGFKISYNELQFTIVTITIMFLLVYYILCEMVGQSIGKKILGIKIVYSGKGIIAKILRPFLKLITLYIWPLGVISIFLPKKLLFYDYILKTNIEEIKPDISRGSLR